MFYFSQTIASNNSIIMSDSNILKKNDNNYNIIKTPIKTPFGDILNSAKKSNGCPDFSKMHQKAFSAQKSITDIVHRV